MKKIFLLFLSLYFTSMAFSQNKPNLQRIEPMNWWVGMHNPNLQLMVYGKQIATLKVSLNYAGVTLKKVNQVENPNYLFLDLEIAKDTKSGSFPIYFSDAKGNKILNYTYQLQDRNTNPDRNQGVTSKDLIYLIMPDRFSNGDEKNDQVKGMKEQTLNRDSMYYRHGGDLQGIINHLDDLKDLGITAIWNTPEIENDMENASYHGYAVTNHYKIDPRYGSNELYKSYVEAAHSKGLKIIKDIVHNHIGTEHWMFKDLPMKDWVHQWPEFTQTNYRDQSVMDPHGSQADRKKMLDGWFVQSMPDLNHDNIYVQNYLTQNHIWWIEYAGIDGLRLDTYPYNDPAYMADWAQKVLAEFPHLSIFGECLVWSAANQAYFAGGNTVNRGFDTHLPGVTDAVVKDAIYETLNGKDGWTEGINRLYAVMAQDFLYKHPENNVIFLDNHDMSRFLSVVNEDINKYKSGIALLLTLRGIPQLYYGTEILMKNFSNPDGLVRFDYKGGWKADDQNKFTTEGRTEEENDAYNYVKNLANYRKNSSALQTGKMMQFVPENGIYVYFRYDEKQTVMVILNKNDKEMELPTQRFAERMQGFTRGYDVIHQKEIEEINTVIIPANSTQIMELKP